MNDIDHLSDGLRRSLAARDLEAHADAVLAHDLSNQEFLARAATAFAGFGASRPESRRIDVTTAHATLMRVFDTLETLQLRCSVLEAEKAHAQQASDALLGDAFDRIRTLEDVVTTLMRLVSKYDALLLESADRTVDAEHRASFAELRARDSERGASDAVEWLYRYMSDSIDLRR